MYVIKIGDEEIMAKDYAVVNIDGKKTLYITLKDDREMAYAVNTLTWSVGVNEL